MDDRRERPRYEVQIAGKLMSTDMSFCVDVAIEDLSENGALVHALAPIDLVPSRVYLWQAQTRTLFECVVQWRKSPHVLGLKFADTTSQQRRRSLLESATSVLRREKTDARIRKTAISCTDDAA